MDFGERATGTRDEHYNLISVLYHALHGAENCDRYAAEAEVSGDESLAAFFGEARDAQAELAERAKVMLGIGAVPEMKDEVEPGVGVGSETLPGGTPPVAEIPPDVPEEVPEPVVVRVPPEDFGTTIRALEGGLEELPMAEALDEIDGWRLWLEGSGDPELEPIAGELLRLGDMLRSGGASRADVGSVLGSLGERVRGLAESEVGAPVADELRILGGLLNTASRDLSQ